MSTNIKRWPYMLVGCLVFLCVGLIYSWPIFAPVFGAEFKSWNSAALSLTFTFSMSFFCIGNIFGGPLTAKTSPKIVMIITAVLVAFGFITTTLVRENSIWILYVAYGIICGFGVGLVYNVVLSMVTAWFPDKIGTVSGALMMSFALSTLALGTLASHFMELYSWRIIFTVLGILTPIVVLIGAFMLRMPGKDCILPEKVVSKEMQTVNSVDVSAKEMLKSKSFLIFMIWGLMMLVAIYALMGNAKQVALDIGASASIATLAVAAISLSNGLGRLLMGSAYDKFGHRKTMTLNSILMLASSLIIIASFKTGSTPLMMLGFILTGLGYGGVPPTSSAFVVDFFGKREYAMKFGFISLYILFGSLGSFIAGSLNSKNGTFLIVFYVLIVLEVAAIILNLFISKETVAEEATAIMPGKGLSKQLQSENT